MSFLSGEKLASRFHLRRKSVESYEWWEDLNYAQKFSVSCLYKFGYEICFVRTVKNKSVVVLSHNSSTVTVDQEGMIDSFPSIKTRRN